MTGLAPLCTSVLLHGGTLSLFAPLSPAKQTFPDVKWDKPHIDILCARVVLQPDRFDAVAASNIFGDILSDLGPACTGMIGQAASANLNPEHKAPSSRCTVPHPTSDRTDLTHES